MPRKVVSLTQEILSSESFSNLRTWEDDQFCAQTSKKGHEVKQTKEKGRKGRSTWSKSDKTNVFATKDKLTKAQPSDEIPHAHKSPTSSSTQRSRKTLEEQRQNKLKREKKLLEECQGESIHEKIKLRNQVTNENKIILDAMAMPKDSTSSSTLTRIPTKKMLQQIKVTRVGKTKNRQRKIDKVWFDPRNLQEHVDGKVLKIFKRCNEHFVKINEENEEELVNRGKDKSVCRTISINSNQLGLLKSKKKSAALPCSFQNVYGIQFGSNSISNNRKSKDLNNAHMSEVLLVAHGMSSIKHPAKWTKQDIDNISRIGEQLYRATKDIEPHFVIKGFAYEDKFIRAKISNPVIVGKILSISERSMDLISGLENFFTTYTHGIFETNNLKLYIFHEGTGFYVFDPLGRNEQCERDDEREAALMAFKTLDNVYHLILNLSKINVKAPFKISRIEVIRISEKSVEVDLYTAESEDSNTSRPREFQFLGTNNIAYLHGSLHLNSYMFENIRNCHGLTSSIMAIIYAKIDPPYSWCKKQIDSVLHYGYQLHMECLQDGITKTLSLPDIPSMFYIANEFCAEIALAAYINRVEVKTTRFISDNPLLIALEDAFKSFRSILLECGSSTFAAWRAESFDVFYYFDGYQKNVAGSIDHYSGCATLFMFESIEEFCEIVINRLQKISSQSTCVIHGVKVLNIRKFTKSEQKSQPLLKLANLKYIRPFSVNDIDQVRDKSSILDTITPIKITKSQELRDFHVQPKYQKLTDLNSQSLVCSKLESCMEKMLAERKDSEITQKKTSDETMKLMQEIHSGILNTMFKQKRQKLRENIMYVKEENDWTVCGKFVGHGENIVLKSDLPVLEDERENILNEFEELVDFTLNDKHDLPVHFQILPDKSEIVSGTKSLFKLPLAPSIFDYENYSIVIGIAAILISSKYNISTWSSSTVDYVLGCGQNMCQILTLQHRLDFYTHDEFKLPQIKLNETHYNVTMAAITSGKFNSFERICSELFNTYDRFLIVAMQGSVAVFKRQNYYYLYEYSTCNLVGYRIKNESFGSSCFLRFRDLHSLLRRVRANHDYKDEQKFVAHRIIIKKTSDANMQNSYVPITESQEKIILDSLEENRISNKEKMQKKLNENEEKIRAEKKRLNMSVNDDDFKLDMNVSSSQADNADFEFDKPLYQSWIQLKVAGYQDGKIRGSFGYKDRMNFVEDSIRECHLAAIYSIMYAVHYPFKEMSYRSVDLILENGIKIHENISLDEYSKMKVLNGIAVNNISYDLLIVEWEAKNISEEDYDIKEILTSFFENQKYAFVEGKNCCKVIVKENDSQFHVFDPYDEQDDGKTTVESPIASWSNCDSIESASNLLNDLVKPIKINYVKVLCHRKIKSFKTGYFLFDMPVKDSTDGCNFVDENEDETIHWIESTKTIPWSRLKKLNADGVKRTKWKEYDIEMDKKLYSLYSLWGNIHPNMKLFKDYAGHQYLALCIVSLIMFNMYNIDEWDAILLDSIVVQGHQFFIETINRLKEPKLNLEMQDFNGMCKINNFQFEVSVSHVVYGRLYENDKSQFNLNRALDYVFKQKNIPSVVLLCRDRCLAIGNVNNKTYFMYDCQSYGEPIFKTSQGTTYILKCCCMKILLAAIILSLNVQHHNTMFSLYSINSKLTEKNTKEGDSSEETQQNDRQGSTKEKSTRFADEEET